MRNLLQYPINQNDIKDFLFLIEERCYPITDVGSVTGLVVEKLKGILWKSLKDNPPEINDTPILIFPCITDVGHKITVSNRDFAIKNGLKQGYTHWAEIILPDNYDDECKRIDNLYMYSDED